jgi:uncharacterized membrane protein YvbJ
MKCPNCGGISTDDKVCTECGTSMSVVTDSLDELVEKASVPNLAALFGAAKKQGLIQAQQEYGHAP